ncbi:MAG: tRNA-guanine transglycosylase [Thermanaerothrix sp.]|nr:tRNA-guanine transglycosylase [Thermanaerothrix sp.]
MLSEPSQGIIQAMHDLQPNCLELAHGHLKFPAFLPDATWGVVRGVDATDLMAVETPALMMNTFHLVQKPGAMVVNALGGLHQMSGWSRPIFTDSGGFQAYSLIQQQSQRGKITVEGIHYQPEGRQRKFLMTPEKVVEWQLRFGSDVLFCLDVCTHVDAPLAAQREAVELTIAWARRSKVAYQHWLDHHPPQNGKRPLIFAVIQGGGSMELRRQCAEALLEIGFDGFGFGGWPLDRRGRLLTDILAWVRECVPSQFPLHALGIGHPQNLASGYRLGYGLFDCAMPTRDARHGRLYRFTTWPPRPDPEDESWWEFVHMDSDRLTRQDQPISPYCDALCCRHYSAGYLRHLYLLGDGLYQRLATLHNLRFMHQLSSILRQRENDDPQ